MLGQLVPDSGKVGAEVAVVVAQTQLSESTQLELRQKPLEQISPDWQLALLPQVPLQVLGVPVGPGVGDNVSVAVGVGVGEPVPVAVGVSVGVIVGVGVGEPRLKVNNWQALGVAAADAAWGIELGALGVTACCRN